MYNIHYYLCQQQSDKYCVMQKTINVILYTPGCAGNFLSLVLSLDKRTVPWIPVGATLEDDSKRKEFYSFSTLHDSTKGWFSHHDQFNPRITDFMKSPDYDTMVLRLHPSIYYETHRNVLEHTDAANAKINFLVVNVSPEVEYEHVQKFKERNDLHFFRQENQLLERFESEHEAFKINLDNLFSTEEDFLAEYNKVNDYLGLPSHEEDALWMYRDWRKARDTERSDDAKKESNQLIYNQLAGLLKYRTLPDKKMIWCVW